MKKILIKAGEVEAAAELDESETARAIWQALPLEGSANTWGEEIYFSIPVNAEQDPEAREDVEVGELAYWPVGKAFCIFFGPTPVSRDEKPRAYSPVNVFGRVLGDATAFKGIANGARIRVNRKYS